MKQRNNKYYVVWRGRQPGIYDSWEACEEKIKNYPNAEFLSFPSFEEAQKAFQRSYPDALKDRRSVKNPTGDLPIADSYCVDASCRGNPGIVEYQCVHTGSREVIFRAGPFKYGTNNIGEFLAIVHALAWLKDKNSTAPIYSDSDVALKWVKEKKCGTKLELKNKNDELLDRIQRAENWLAKEQYLNPVLKWRTDLWGEIAADFHRK